MTVNPKERFGGNKVPMSCVPVPVMMEVALAMLEGAMKYGRHNYRSTEILSSTYYDAATRHIGAWWEGENNDPDSGLSHISKAIASLIVLRDSMIMKTMVDDRPKSYPDGWMDELNAHVSVLKDKLGKA